MKKTAKSTLHLSLASIVAMITYLGSEPVEGTPDDNAGQLDELLNEHGMSVDQFVTEPTIFAAGYTRGLQAMSFSDDQMPLGEDGIDKGLAVVFEDGYAFGLELRDAKRTPPANLVYEAYKSGVLKTGQAVQWADGLDLGGTFRLGAALTVGSGKSSVVIPANTPVQILKSDFEKDGVPHVIALYDGAALLVPNPEDAPRIIDGADAVSVQKTGKKGRSKGGSGGARKSSGPKAPTLQDAIRFVIEGEADGSGAGPLQENGSFAARVRARAVELGIGDKATTFMQKADSHVPYYLNGYKPATKDGAQIPGRTGHDKPLVWCVAAIEARKYYLRAEGTHEQRVAAIPQEYRDRMEDRSAVIDLTPSTPAADEKAEAQA